MSTILNKIKSNYSKVFRRVLIKRRNSTSGAFESTWQDISADVKKWGKIRRQIDYIKFNKITFSDVIMQFENSDGRYNPNTDDSSFWLGYVDQQRTLVKLESGFYDQTLASSGIWSNTELPTTSSIFYGIMSGDIFLSDDNQVSIPVKPLLQVFRDYPARNLRGFTSTGLTASQFFTLLRDQTDGSANFVFRPFFGDTTSNWNIQSTTNVYSNLNTTTAEDVIEASVWDVMEKITEAEDAVTYVDRFGVFNFQPRTVLTTTSQFHFFGQGFFDTEYGKTIKKITRYGKKQSDFYTKIQVKFNADDTATSYVSKETAFTVTGNNDAWVLGHRLYNLENLWIPNTATAQSIADSIYTNATSLKDQIEFSSSFVPHLDILNRVTISYDTGAQNLNYRWDTKDWFDTSSAADVSDGMYWDMETGGDAIRLSAVDFKILAYEIDLDGLETKISAVKI